MAKKGNGSLLNMLQSVNNATRATNGALYGVTRDPAGLINDEIDAYLKDMRNADKQIINSQMSRHRINMNSSKNDKTDIKDLYDIVTDKDIMGNLKQMVGSENMKLSQLLKDYEIIKRCIPEVNRTITSMVNNILSPDSFTNNCIGIEFPANMDESERKRVNEVLKKYKLNEKISKWVLEYLVVSTKYISVVPYNKIPDMLRKEDDKETKRKKINEAIEFLTSQISPTTTLYEAAGKGSVEPITESIKFDGFVDQFGHFYETEGTGRKKYNEEISSKNLKEAVDEVLKGIEFVYGEDYYKAAALNEAIALSHTIDTSDKEVKSLVKTLKNATDSKHSKNGVDPFNAVADGFVDDKKLDEINQKVKFRGCFVEELPAAKVIPFKLRGTIIGYFYVEDKYDYIAKNGYSENLANIMSKINSSVYLNNTDLNVNAGQKAENVFVKAITDKLIKTIDARFINDNYKDIEAIYNFVKENQLYRDKKKIVFFKPDELFDIRREDGSIMKNCMFMAKLYILLLLNNIITKVTRGYDRNNYYMKQQMTTDVEGSVRNAIWSIKANQFRYSDMNTINQIFNIPGSQVDLFLPIAEDGSRPIELETQAGQNVDMNDEFLKWLVRSIVKSFGNTPAGVVDEYENINFARSISSSNLEYALGILNAQGEISPVLSDIFRAILKYDFPECSDPDGIELKFTAPSAIIDSMVSDKINAISSTTELIASLVIPQPDETPVMKQNRLFKLSYFKKNVPTIDWEEVELMVKASIKDAAKEIKEEKIPNPDNTNNAFGDMNGLGGDDMGEPFPEAPTV